jgi:hypothetical protein
MLFGGRHLENFGYGEYFNQNWEYLVAISATYTTLHTMGTWGKKNRKKKEYNLFQTPCMFASRMNCIEPSGASRRLRVEAAGRRTVPSCVQLLCAPGSTGQVFTPR